MAEVWQPQVTVHLGDLLEGDAASRWPNDKKVSLVEEYESAARLLEQVRGWSPKGRYVLLAGNHDDNIAAPNRIPKEMREACQPENNLALGGELRHWERIPYINSDKGAFWLGKVCFKHGYSTNDDIEALEFAGDTPSPLIVGGHTHRPVPVTRCMRTKRVPLHVWHANAGHLGPSKPDYVMRQSTRLWGHALIVGATSPVRWASGREWMAEVIPL